MRGNRSLSLFLVILLLPGALSACRWVHNTPARIALEGEAPPPAQVFQYLVGRARSLGYTPQEVDASAMTFRVQAHVHAYQPTFFMVQLTQDQRVSITASGALVVEGGREIHSSVREELEAFVNNLGATLGELPGARRSTGA